MTGLCSSIRLIVLAVAILVTLPLMVRADPPESARSVIAAFRQGQFDEAIRIFESLPPDQHTRADVAKAAIKSYLHAGRPETAYKTYLPLVPDGRPENVPLLKEILYAVVTAYARDPQEHLRITAFTALREVPGLEVRPLLEDARFDGSVVVRALAVEGLSRLAREKSAAPAPIVAVLKQSLEDPAPVVRMAAITGLGEIGDRTVAEALRAIARSDDGPTHIFALGALMRLGHVQAVEEIIAAATLPDPDVRMAALGVIGRFKIATGFKILSQSVYDPDAAVRAFAAGALGDYGAAEGAAALTHAIGDEAPRVRSVAAASLGRLNLEHTRPLLWQAAKDPVALVRVGGVEGLLRLRDPEAVLIARELANHPDPSIRGALAQAIGQARGRPALQLLDGLRRDLQPQPRLMAVRALGKFEGPQPIPILKQTVLDTDPAVRVAAAGSLLQVLKAPQ